MASRQNKIALVNRFASVPLKPNVLLLQSFSRYYSAEYCPLQY